MHLCDITSQAGWAAHRDNYDRMRKAYFLKAIGETAKVGSPVLDAADPKTGQMMQAMFDSAAAGMSHGGRRH